jgi:hypothetical protein
VAITLKSFNNGAVGFIDWLDMGSTTGVVPESGEAEVSASDTK